MKIVYKRLMVCFGSYMLFMLSIINQSAKSRKNDGNHDPKGADKWLEGSGR